MQPTWKTLAAKTITTAGTRVQITATAHQAFAVMISADSGNTGKIYVGDSTVSSTNGVELSPGESISWDASASRGGSQPITLTDIYLDTATNGNKARIQFTGWP